MDLLLPLLSSLFLFIIVVEANHPSLEPQVYWRTILPHTPIPSAIEQLLQPDVYDKTTDTSVNVGKDGVNVDTGEGTTVSVGDGGVNVNTGKGTTVNVGHAGVGVNTGNSKPGGTTVGVGKGGVNVNTGKGTSVDVGHGGVGVQTGPTHKPGGTTVNVGKGGVGVAVKPKGKPVVVHANPFIYNYAASDDQLHDDPAVALFFLRRDLIPGKKFSLQIADNAAATAFIPRSAAESVPFSTAELPSILSRFSIPVGSAEAAATKKTLSECEAAPVAGETKLCATSLESMVDFATRSLGTREVVAVATEGGTAAGEREVYKVGSVRKVAAAGGKGVVACHPEAYAYAVFFCHATAASEVYEVEMAAVEGGGSALKAVAVCHTDTARWNPKHLAFRVLKVKPGTVPVCHFLPRDHVVWARKV